MNLMVSLLALATASPVVRPVDPATGRSPVAVTFPNVLRDGTTSLTIAGGGPNPFPEFVLGDPATYFDLTTTVEFVASSDDPITVCIDYAGMRYMNETALELFQYQTRGWAMITSFRDVDAKRLCGNAVSLGIFAIFEPENHPPVANAGPAQAVEATGPEGATVRLNGAASYDPDRERVQYEWQEQGRLLASSAVAQRILSLGSHDLVLTLTDARGASASASTSVTVRDTIPPTVRLVAPLAGTLLAGTTALQATALDVVGVAAVRFEADGRAIGDEGTGPPYSVAWNTRTVGDGPHSLTAIARDLFGNAASSAAVTLVVDNTPPALQVSAAPATLHPPDFWRFVPVTVTATTSDSVDPAPALRLVGVTCNEPCNVAADVVDAAYGTADLQFQLRAWTHTGTGRVYTITYSATDAAGNTTTATTAVSVLP